MDARRPARCNPRAVGFPLTPLSEQDRPTQSRELSPAAERLSRSEERFRLAVRAANDVIWDWDAHANEAEWSEALRTVLGWDPEAARNAAEGTHRWWSERVHPDDRSRVVASYHAALADPDVDHWEAEYRFRRADGSWAAVIDRAFLVRDAMGKVRRAVGAMQDVSARVATMAALREGEARFRALVEAVTSAVWRTDPEGRALEDAPGWRALTGLTEQQVRGFGWMRALHPDDVESSREAWLRARDARRTYEVEHRLRTVDGTWRWFLSRGVPVLDDATGEIREWVGMHQDVDDRRRREAAERFLARATAALNVTLDYEGVLRAIAQLSLDEIADGCVVHLARADGGFEVAAVASRDDVEGAGETGAVEAHGSGASGAAAHEVSLLVPEVDDAALAAVATCHEHLDRLRRLGMRSGMCVPLMGPSGTIGTITLASRAPARERPFTERELGAAEELGRRAARAVEHAREFRATVRARAAAEAESQAKSDFLAVLTHEIRTPLNAIVGYGQLLADAVTGPVSDEQRAQLRRIVSSAAHLRTLIDEVLTLSRIEAGHEEVRREPVDVGALVDEAIDLVALAARTKGLRLVRDVPAARCVVHTDRTKLLQAVVNLAGNAVKFTERGEVAFTVRAVPGRAEIEVRDTGVGIAPEHQRQIYEPFWQVDQHSQPPEGGTGLGLSVVRHLMQLLDGGVRAESLAGQGSRFTVWVPVAES